MTVRKKVLVNRSHEPFVVADQFVACFGKASLDDVSRDNPSLIDLIERHSPQKFFTQGDAEIVTLPPSALSHLLLCSEANGERLFYFCGITNKILEL